MLDQGKDTLILLDSFHLDRLAGPLQELDTAGIRMDGSELHRFRTALNAHKFQCMIVLLHSGSHHGSRRSLNILKFVTNTGLLQAAVRGDWKIVRQIKGASEDLWAEAVRQDIAALRFVPNPTEKILLAAISKDWKLLQDIERPSAAMVAEAVRQDYHALEFVSIKRRTEAVQMAAVRTDPRCIQFLERASEAIQMAAVRGDKSVFALIKNPAASVVEYCK